MIEPYALFTCGEADARAEKWLQIEQRRPAQCVYNDAVESPQIPTTDGVRVVNRSSVWRLKINDLAHFCFIRSLWRILRAVSPPVVTFVPQVIGVPCSWRGFVASNVESELPAPSPSSGVEARAGSVGLPGKKTKFLKLRLIIPTNWLKNVWRWSLFSVAHIQKSNAQPFLFYGTKENCH